MAVIYIPTVGFPKRFPVIVAAGATLNKPGVVVADVLPKDPLTVEVIATPAVPIKLPETTAP